jgi:hypothetical protein
MARRRRQPAGRSVCAETIYQAVWAKGAQGLPADAHRHLHSRQRRHLSRCARKARTGRPGPLGAFKPLTARRAAAEERAELE